MSSPSQSARIHALISQHCATHALGFRLSSGGTEDWDLIEALSGIQRMGLSMNIFLLRRKSNPAQVVRYEVTEAPSWPMADTLARSMAGMSMAAHRLEELHMGSNDHKSMMVQGARLALLDPAEEGFHALILTLGNLACRIESAGDEPVDLDDLGGLRPQALLMQALSIPDAAGEGAALRFPAQVKRGERFRVEIASRPSAKEGWWLMLIADTPQGNWLWKGQELTFATDENLNATELGFYVMCLRHQTEKIISGPFTLPFS